MCVLFIVLIYFNILIIYEKYSVFKDSLKNFSINYECKFNIMCLYYFAMFNTQCSTDITIIIYYNYNSLIIILLYIIFLHV